MDTKHVVSNQTDYQVLVEIVDYHGLQSTCYDSNQVNKLYKWFLKFTTYYNLVPEILILAMVFLNLWFYYNLTLIAKKLLNFLP